MAIAIALTGIAIIAMAAKFGGAIVTLIVWLIKFSIGVVALTGIALIAGIVLANLFG